MPRNITIEFELTPHVNGDAWGSVRLLDEARTVFSINRYPLVEAARRLRAWIDRAAEVPAPLFVFRRTADGSAGVRDETIEQVADEILDLTRSAPLSREELRTAIDDFLEQFTP